MKLCCPDDGYWWKREESFGFAVSLPMIEPTRQAEVRAGVDLRRSSATMVDDIGDSVLEPHFFTGRSTELYGAIVFSNAKIYPLSFSPEDGVRIQAFYRTWHRSLGGEQKGIGGDVDLRAYKGLTHHLVVAFRLMGIKGIERDIEYGFYGQVSPTGQDSTLMTSRAALGSAEIRFRIRETQAKMIWDWIFANRLHGALFYDLGYYYDQDSEDGSLWKRSHSCGVRLSLDSTVGFTIPITWDVIVAIPSLGEPRAYLQVMTAF
jgi:hypothetical protein